MYNETLESLIVVKRSGQRVEFNASKVAIAIKKAFDSINDKNEDKVFKTFEKVLSYINDNYKDRKTINVEDIQDIIEKILYSQKYFDVYTSFKEYRNKRSLSRKVFSEKQQHKFLKAIEKFEENDFKNQTITPYDIIYKFGKIIYSEYTKAYVLDNKSVKAMEEGNIYIHNLDYFSLGILSNTHLKLSKQYEELDELISEMINSQKEINGEIGINQLDIILEKFLIREYRKLFKINIKKYLKLFGFYEFINIKKIEELIDKESDIEFDIERFGAFIFNDQIKNIIENSFKETKDKIIKLSEKYLLRIVKNLENCSERNTTYLVSFGTNKTLLGKIINNNIIDIFTSNEFTKINIVLKLDKTNLYFIDFTSILKNNKTIYLNLVNDKNIEYFSNGIKIYENINGKNISNGRMVVSNTSINLARLGLKYQNKSLDLFFEELDALCEVAKNQMCLSFEAIGNKTKENYEVLFNGNILDDDKLEENGQKIRKVIKNGCLCLGIVGLKECVIALECDKLKQIKLIHKILDYLNDKCQKYRNDTKLNFGIYETTSKDARTNLLRIDKAIYGTLKNITDKKYYELIDYDYIEDYNQLGQIQQKFEYGKLIRCKLSSKFSNKKIFEMVETLENNNISFVKVVVGKNEY